MSRRTPTRLRCICGCIGDYGITRHTFMTDPPVQRLSASLKCRHCGRAYVGGKAERRKEAVELLRQAIARKKGWC